MLVSILGCGQKKLDLKPIANNQSLKAYMEDVAHESPVKMSTDYPISFDDEGQLNDNSATVARCIVVNNKPFGIVVRRSDWNGASEIKKYAIITHEMVHCSLLLSHVIEGEPESGKLMSRYIHDSIFCLSKKDISGCIQESIDLYYAGKIPAISSVSSQPHSHHDGCQH